MNSKIWWLFLCYTFEEFFQLFRISLFDVVEDLPYVFLFYSEGKHELQSRDVFDMWFEIVIAWHEKVVIGFKECIQDLLGIWWCVVAWWPLCGYHGITTFLPFLVLFIDFRLEYIQHSKKWEPSIRWINLMKISANAWNLPQQKKQKLALIRFK